MVHKAITEIGWLLEVALERLASDFVLLSLRDPDFLQFKLVVLGAADTAPRTLISKSRNSFCEVVTSTGEPLSVSALSEYDARCCGFLHDAGAQAYLGYPVRNVENATIASFAAASRRPRIWSDKDHRNLRMAAQCASDALICSIRPEPRHYVELFPVGKS